MREKSQLQNDKWKMCNRKSHFNLNQQKFMIPDKKLWGKVLKFWDEKSHLQNYKWNYLKWKVKFLYSKSKNVSYLGKIMRRCAENLKWKVKFLREKSNLQNDKWKYLKWKVKFLYKKSVI